MLGRAAGIVIAVVNAMSGFKENWMIDVCALAVVRNLHVFHVP